MEEIEKICPRCGETLKEGIVFHNKDEIDKRGFTHMKKGESMHGECYIEHVIDTYLKKVM